jgi:hypothetical protein
MKTFLHLWQYLAELFSEWEMFQIKFVKKMKTHFVFCNSPPPPPKIMPFKRRANVEKCGGAADDNVWALCMMDN